MTARTDSVTRTIDGPYRGDLTDDVVEIVRDGSVVGNVRARVVRVKGRIEGDVFAEKFHAGPTARIRGRVSAAEIGIMPGARLEAYVASDAAPAFEPSESTQPAVGADLDDVITKLTEQLGEVVRHRHLSAAPPVPEPAPAARKTLPPLIP